MGRIIRNIMIDEYIWTQFQALYPRQASRMVEDTFRDLINLKLNISDEEGEHLKAERQSIASKAAEVNDLLKEYDIKIRAWEAKKREDILKEKEEIEQAQFIAGKKVDALRNAGAGEYVKW